MAPDRSAWRRLAVLTVWVLGGTGPLLGCVSDLCSNTRERLIVSPDGEHQVAVTKRDCGATTGWNTQLVIEHAGADGAVDPDDGVMMIRGAPARLDVEIRWTSATSVVVGYDDAVDNPAAPGHVVSRRESLQLDGTTFTVAFD